MTTNGNNVDYDYDIELNDAFKAYVSRSNDLTKRHDDLTVVIKLAREINIGGTDTMVAGWQAELRKVENEISDVHLAQKAFEFAFKKVFTDYRPTVYDFNRAGFFIENMLKDMGFVQLDPELEVRVSVADLDSLLINVDREGRHAGVLQLVTEFVTAVKGE